jgi:hypothetical protein
MLRLSKFVVCILFSSRVRVRVRACAHARASVEKNGFFKPSQAAANPNNSPQNAK